MNKKEQQLIGEEATKALDPIQTWKTQYNRFLDSLGSLKVTILKDRTTRERTHLPSGDPGPAADMFLVHFKIEGPLYMPTNLPYDTGHFKNEKEFLNSEFFGDLGTPVWTPGTTTVTNPIEKLMNDQGLQFKRDSVEFKVKAIRMVRDPVNPDVVHLYFEAVLEAQKSTAE